MTEEHKKNKYTNGFLSVRVFFVRHKNGSEKMSVGLYKYDRHIYDEKSKLILSENIASQGFYKAY